MLWYDSNPLFYTGHLHKCLQTRGDRESVRPDDFRKWRGFVSEVLWVQAPWTLLCAQPPAYFSETSNSISWKSTVGGPRSRDGFSCMFSQLTTFLDDFEEKSPFWKHPRSWRKEGVLSSIGNSKLVEWKSFVPKLMVLGLELRPAKCHLCLFLINLLKCLLILKRF